MCRHWRTSVIPFLPSKSDTSGLYFANVGLALYTFSQHCGSFGPVYCVSSCLGFTAFASSRNSRRCSSHANLADLQQCQQTRAAIYAKPSFEMLYDPKPGLVFYIKRIKLAFLKKRWKENKLARQETIFHPAYALNVSLLPLQCGDRLSPSESDVCRRQVMTTKIDPCTVRVNMFIMAVDP